MRLAVGATIVIVALSLLSVLVTGQEAGAADEELLRRPAVVEEPVKRVHVLNPGEREYLSPNLIGVQNIAMTFLPLTMNFVNIIDAFREIVDGVRYEIVLNAVDTKAKDADVVCRLVIIERPWLRTEWGDKVRELRTTNCTSEDDTLTDQAARSKALNDKYTRNALFNGGTRNELTDDEMSKLESQILPMPFATNDLKRRDATTSTTTTSTTATAPTSISTAATTSEQLSTEATARNEDTTAAAEAATTSAAADVNDEDNAESTSPLPVLTQDEMKWLDDFLSVGALSFEQTQRERQEAEQQSAAGDSSNDGVSENAASNYVQQQQQQQPQQELVESEGEVATEQELLRRPAVVEEPVKRVHVLNPGEREYLSPNLIGVQNIAMTFLPLTMNFVNIIDAFREIVDGVRYEIVLNAVDTKAKDADVVCRLVIIERPWLRTEWGDKVRELRTTNCTSEDDTLTDQAARSKALNDKYTRNALFNGGTRNELTDDEMSKLESQILPMPFATNDLKRRDATTSTTTTSTTTTAPTSISTAATTSEQLSTEATARNEDTTAAAEAATTSTAADVNDEDNAESTSPLPVLTQDEMKWLDDFLSVGALSFEQTQRERQEAEQQSAAGDSSNDGVSENAASNYVQQQQQQQPQQELVESEGEVATEQVHARAKRSSNLVGGAKTLDKKDAEQRLQASLDKLAAGDGPNYRISKVYSATTQVVSGTLTKIDVELFNENDEKERCTVKIWAQPWLPNGYEVTFDCPNKELVKRRHSRSVEQLEKKTHKKRNHHSLDKTEHLFSKFQIKYNRRYHTAMEHQMRLRIFKQNLEIIKELNRNEMGSAKYGITEFADLTSTEYKQRTGLWQRSEDKPSKNAPAVIPNIELPKEFDWREKGVISKVKNQGMCGSCWAFSVTGNVEGLHAVKTGKLEEYSEQELLDCDTSDSACNGGLMDNAYEAIEHIGGLELESDYPYEGRKDQCKFSKSKVHVKVKGGVDLPKNETAIAQWLIANGPISIGINANAMQFYRGGVSHPWKALCSKKNLDHGVLIVGYGVSDYPMFKKTLPYWIVKNSWGPKWGEQGYYRVYRGDNTCGVSEMASSAVLE